MVIAVLILLLFMASFFLPKEAHVERSALINSSQAKLFDYLNTTKNFNQWSPWFEMDPNGDYKFSGPEMGVGGILAWDGEKTGKGTQEIVESNPYQNIKLKLIFDGQPPAYASYKLEPVEGGTKVTWGFDTSLNGPVEKYMGLMMDSFVGDMYDKGLDNLKAKVEAMPDGVSMIEANLSNKSEQVRTNDMYQPEVIEVEPFDIAYIASRADFDGDLISKELAASYGKIIGLMTKNGINFAGSPLAITTGGSPEEGFWAFEAALPVDKVIVTDEGDEIQFKKTYGGKAVKLVHKGPYMDMASSYKKLAEFVYGNNLVPNGNVWEQYVSDPGNTPEEELMTHLFFPVK